MQALLAIPGVGSLLEGLASYSQRHFQRMDRLARSAFLLDYTLGSIRVYLGEDAADTSTDGQRGEGTAVGQQPEGSTGADPAASTAADQDAQQARPPRAANGHARPHEQTNGHSHPQSASSSDAEFGGHDVGGPVAGAAAADIREPVHLGTETNDDASTQQDAVEQAEPKQRAKRKRRKVDMTATDAERGDDGADDAGGSDAQQAAGDDAADDAGGDVEDAATPVDAGQPSAPGSRGGRADGAGAKKRKKKKKRRKAVETPPAEASSAKASTADAGTARKAKRTPS